VPVSNGPTRGGLEIPFEKRLNSRAAVERALRWNIGTGVWQPGDALPSERVLAAQLGVGRSTLRAAIDVLRREGLLVTSVGRNGRTWLAESSAAIDTPAPTAEMRRDIINHFELRFAVVPAAAELAADRGTTAEFEQLRTLLRQSVTSVRRYHALEAQFDMVVADACGNRRIRNVVAELCVDFLGWANAVTPRAGPSAAGFDGTLGSEYSAIYEALMIRDGDGARAAATARLTAARDSYESVFASGGSG
jgi:DNA-binding FadR family transcriptional regulator